MKLIISKRSLTFVTLFAIALVTLFACLRTWRVGFSADVRSDFASWIDSCAESAVLSCQLATYEASSSNAAGVATEISSACDALGHAEAAIRLIESVEYLDLGMSSNALNAAYRAIELAPRMVESSALSAVCFQLLGRTNELTELRLRLDNNRDVLTSREEYILDVSFGADRDAPSGLDASDLRLVEFIRSHLARQSR
jgi:hypothetical protein